MVFVLINNLSINYVVADPSSGDGNSCVRNILVFVRTDLNDFGFRDGVS